MNPTNFGLPYWTFLQQSRCTFLLVSPASWVCKPSQGVYSLIIQYNNVLVHNKVGLIALVIPVKLHFSCNELWLNLLGYYDMKCCELMHQNDPTSRITIPKTFHIQVNYIYWNFINAKPFVLWLPGVTMSFMYSITM